MRALDGKEIVQRIRDLNKDARPWKHFLWDHKIPDATLLNWTRTTKPSWEKVLEFAKKLDVPPEWLAYGEYPTNARAGDDTGEEDTLSAEFTYIPLYEVRAAAGSGAFVEREDIKGQYAFREEWVKKAATSKDNLMLAFVEGDSMEPTLRKNDMILIDRGRRDVRAPRRGDPLPIFAVGESDTVSVKRVALKKGHYTLHSDNEAYGARRIPANDLRIIGRVIWFARELGQ